MNTIIARLHVRFHARERGQTMAEYVIVLGIISVTILVALGALAGSIGGGINRITSDI